MSDTGSRAATSKAEAPAPSGRQVEIRSGPWRAVVVEVGGGLRELVRADWAVLDGYPVEQMADGGRGAPLLPTKWTSTPPTMA
jgi:hypothetical protein